jgi:hypothetical protein
MWLLSIIGLKWKYDCEGIEVPLLYSALLASSTDGVAHHNKSQTNSSPVELKILTLSQTFS